MLALHRTNLIAFAIIAVATALPLASPALAGPAIVLAFFIPGFGLLRLFRFQFGALEKALFSVLISVLATTLAVYAISLAIGYSTLSIVLSLELLSLPILFADLRLPRLRGEDRLPLIAAVASGLLAFGILFASLWVPNNCGIAVGGWNYGDFFLHRGLIQNTNCCSFPPASTFYAGEPLRYHWFVDLHTAFLSLVSGSAPEDIVRAEVGVYVFLYFLAAFLLARRFLGKRELAFIAVILILFGSSFAYFHFFDDLQHAPADKLIGSRDYDNDWSFFVIPSTFNAYMLTQRPQQIGLPALAAVALLLVSGLDKRRLLLASLLAGALAGFQLTAFLAVMFIGLVWLVLQRRLDLTLHWLLPGGVIGGVLLLPLLNRLGSAISLNLGWMAPHNPLGFLSFYIANLGVPFILALVSLKWLNLKQRKNVLLVVWLAAMWAIPNLIVFQGSPWDMAKFFTYAWIPIGILAAYAFGHIPRLAWPILILASVFSTMLASAWFVNSTWGGLSADELAAGNWIMANTPKDAVFVTSDQHNSPVDSVGGRPRLLGYPGWTNAYNLPSEQRLADIKTVYCGSPEQATAAMSKYGARYVYFSDAERGAFKCGFPSANSTAFEPVFSQGSVQIYRMR